MTGKCTGCGRIITKTAVWDGHNMGLCKSCDTIKQMEDAFP